MDVIAAEAFFDELEKIGSVELILHGYNRDPDKLMQPFLDASERREKFVGPFPNRKKGLFSGIRTNLARKAYMKRGREFDEKNPTDLDAYDKASNYSRDSRIKTPFDRMADAGKVHSRVLIGGDADQYTTDRAYGPNRTRNLSKEDLGTLAEVYKKSRTGEVPEAEEAFLNKIKHLQGQKDLKFARLEYS